MWVYLSLYLLVYVKQKQERSEHTKLGCIVADISLNVVLYVPKKRNRMHRVYDAI